MKEFFHMGGYALYVWPSYALALLILIANLVAPMLQRRRLLADIARKLRRARREK
jgi:heme exporter protein D